MSVCFKVRMTITFVVGRCKQFKNVIFFSLSDELKRRRFEVSSIHFIEGEQHCSVERLRALISHQCPVFKLQWRLTLTVVGSRSLCSGFFLHKNQHFHFPIGQFWITLWWSQTKGQRQGFEQPFPVSKVHLFLLLVEETSHEIWPFPVNTATPLIRPNSSYWAASDLSSVKFHWWYRTTGSSIGISSAPSNNRLIIIQPFQLHSLKLTRLVTTAV